MIPLAHTVAARLWKQLPASGPADLSRHLVLVPTAQAGRLLREALRRLSAEASRPLLVPQILTPEEYVDRFVANLPVASTLDSLAAFAGILQAAVPGQFPALFPRLPDLGTYNLALGCAEPLLELRSTLGENGLDCATVLTRLPPDHPEQNRWADLARIEELYRQALAQHGLLDRQDARARLLSHPATVVPCDTLWLAALPDPQPLLITHLQGLSPAPEIRLIPFAHHAPGLLDDWGRALPEAWADRSPAWTDFDAQTHLLATPGDASPWLLARCAEKPAASRLTLGLLAPDLLPPLREALASLGARLHDHGGRPFPRHWLGQLLELAADCAEEPAYRLLPRLLTFPAVAAWTAAQIPHFNLTQTLQGLDAIAQKHLPDTLPDALGLIPDENQTTSSTNQTAGPTSQATTQAARFLRLISTWRSDLLSQSKLGVPPDPASQSDTAFQPVPASDLKSQISNLKSAPPLPVSPLSLFPSSPLPASSSLQHWLSTLVSLTPPASDPFLENAWKTLSLHLQQLPELARRHRVDSPADRIRLLLRGLEHVTLPEPPDPDAIPALGWLELLWDDAPHLILAGVNEGLVPAAPAPDPFLPDSLRTLLGLRDRASRHARDTAILDALLRRRAPPPPQISNSPHSHLLSEAKSRPSGASDSSLITNNSSLASSPPASPTSHVTHHTSHIASSASPPSSRLDCLILQTAANGDPLRPSRLLLQGAATDLPRRVLRLFREPTPAAPEPAWQAGWKLAPSLASDKKQRRLSVTDFKGYLDCPFRYFLRKHVGMETFDPAKAELDARDFGDLLHHVLEEFGKDADAVQLSDPDEILAWTEHRLRRHVRHLYGDTLPLAVLVQQEAAASRLQGFARHQAALREEGWRIVSVERSFEQMLGKPWLLEGWEIRGRFDRLDQHPDGRWRVIDYKTADKPSVPSAAHWAKPRDSDPWPRDYARGDRFNDKGQTVPFVWTNLQLPLYVELLTATGLPPEKLSAAYFNLPKALTDASVSEFAELTPDLRASALACAQGVLADLSAQRYWPPREKTAYDDFAQILSPEPAAVVDPSGMEVADGQSSK